MSEVIVTGAAGVALGACVAAAALVAGTAFVAYKALSWLSAEAVSEIEQLERSLAAPLTQPTTREARQEFQEKLAIIRDQAYRSPLLRPHTDAIAAMLAVRNSALGRFITMEDAKTLTQPRLRRRSVDDLMRATEGRMNRVATSFVTDAVIESGKAVGFAFKTERSKTPQHETLVLTNAEGRALIAKVQRTADGPAVKLDLTGYSDGSCHNVMDDVLRRLSDKGIRLFDVRRRSHYRREGVLLADAQRTQDANCTNVTTAHDGDYDRRRRAPVAQRRVRPVR